MFSEKLVEVLACINIPAAYALSNIASTEGHPLRHEAVQIELLGKSNYSVKVDLEQEVSKLRLKNLMDSEGSDRPDPYSHPDLETVNIDQNGLVDLAQFDQQSDGLPIGDSVFEILPATDQRHSSYWILQALKKLPEGTNPKVRLDPLMHTPREGYQTMFYKMHVFGQPLNWKKVLALPNETTARWMPDDPDGSDVAFTDTVWTPRGNEIHLRCEECPKPFAAGYKPARYFHTIIDRKIEAIVHCDGALRIFSIDEANERNETHVRDAGKIGTRIKLFQVDDKLDSHTWGMLMKAFFVWNSDIKKFTDEFAAD